MIKIRLFLAEQKPANGSVTLFDNIGVVIILLLLPALHWLLRHMEISDDLLVLAAGGLMMIVIIRIIFKHRGLSEKNNSLFFGLSIN